MYHKGKKNHIMDLLACRITLKLCHWISTSFVRSPGWDQNSVESTREIKLRKNAGKCRVWPFLCAEKAPVTSNPWEKRHKWKWLKGGEKKCTWKTAKLSQPWTFLIERERVTLNYLSIHTVCMYIQVTYSFHIYIRLLPQVVMKHIAFAIVNNDSCAVYSKLSRKESHNNYKYGTNVWVL